MIKYFGKIFKHSPSICTSLGLFFGILTFYMIILNKIDTIAAICMLEILMIFDMVDGRIARKYNLKSFFGMSLDSISDFLNFGILPTVILFKYLLIFYNNQNLLFVYAIYIIAIALRLSRFDSMAILEYVNNKVYNIKKAPNLSYSVGCPAPMCAMLIVFPILYNYTFHTFVSIYLFAIVIFLTSLFAISNIKTPIIKAISFNFRTYNGIILNISSLLIFIGWVLNPIKASILLIFIYILSLFVLKYKN